MNKTYISSLMVVLMAGAQVMAANESDLDALIAGAETEAAAEAVVEQDAAVVVDDTNGLSLQTLMEKGEALYNAGNLDRAEIFYQAAYEVDPYNGRVMNRLMEITRKKNSRKVTDAAYAHEDAMTQVKAAWLQPFEISTIIANEGGTPPVVEEDPEVLAMEARLKEIVIPTLDFKNANIKDVVLFLTEAVRRENNNVNMVLLGLGRSDELGTDEGNDITISIQNLSLYKSLQVITEMASLQFIVEDELVVIMPVNYVRSIDVMQETFTVIPEVGRQLSDMASGDVDYSMDSLFGASVSSGSTSDSGPIDVSSYFSIVEWPKGAKAVYYPNVKQLIVQNSAGNIKQVKAILSNLEEQEIKKRSSQVQIEAKFVEFSEGTWDELGFNWGVRGTGSIAGFNLADSSTFATYSPVYGYQDSASVVTLASGTFNERFSDSGLALIMAGTDGSVSPSTSAGGTARANAYRAFIAPGRGYRVAGGQSLFGGAVRAGTTIFPAITSGLGSTLGGNPASMLFSNGTIDFQINALAQNGTADILSSPKVTVMSGADAVMRVTEIHRYPQDWDVETGQRTAPVVKPQDWEDFDLGVVLNVRPEVDTENDTISLELEPEIRKFKGFDGYHVADNAYDAGSTQTETLRGDGTELFAEMPFFETRSVKTSVTVADGSTVMMGGLVDETTETFRDQVPILGDLPYIGRLFRNEGVRSVKKNLVIFVKATQVDERGMTKQQRAMAKAE